MTNLLRHPNINKTEIKYRNLFSAKSSFSGRRTESTASDNTKANKKVKKKNFDLDKSTKSKIYSNKNSYDLVLKNSFTKDRKERVSDFMEKSRIIRKTKIINIDLKIKYYQKMK